MEISVRRNSGEAFTVLSPRQQITSTPYAIKSLNAETATSFSGSLTGDVTGTQTATVVGSVGGASAASVASAVSAADAATSGNSADTIVKRDASGNFSAGTITATLDGNAATATTANTATTASGVSASAGDSVVAAINAGSSSVTTAHVAGDVELAPSDQQTTSSTNHLINLKLVGSRNLGTAGQDALLSLSASGTYWSGGFTQTFDKERFRVENDGSLLAVSDYNSGCCGGIPIEGSGTRFMWFGGKAALRAGSINGTQWDDANIGLYSTAFGENVRALGDNAIVVGKNSVAANTGTVALGEGHTATGANSVALGYGASTATINGSPRTGTFVFSDRSVPLTYTFNSTSPDIASQFHPTVTNSFNVRAVNGSFFYTNTALTTGFIFNSTTATMTLTNSKLTMASDGSTTLTSNSGGSTGVTLPAGGGSWNNLSDRNMKANFAAVDPRAILRGVLALPISTWNYKSQDASVRHIGPMAQDFFAAFKVGEGDKTIATIDPDGVALAAIQGLNEELKDRDAKIDALQRQARQQQNQIDGLKKLLCLNHPDAQVCKESR
ncbi:MAG TPA: tail fiber domain-containing protein [Pyrinomonadaceae bacterium]|nr:tail fiber domain-containing protein [Pyrinomonadaceae bacterium]